MKNPEDQLLSCKLKLEKIEKFLDKEPKDSHFLEDKFHDASQLLHEIRRLVSIINRDSNIEAYKGMKFTDNQESVPVPGSGVNKYLGEIEDECEDTDNYGEEAESYSAQNFHKIKSEKLHKNLRTPFDLQLLSRNRMLFSGDIPRLDKLPWSGSRTRSLNDLSPFSIVSVVDGEKDINFSVLEHGPWCHLDQTAVDCVVRQNLWTAYKSNFYLLQDLLKIGVVTVSSKREKDRLLARKGSQESQGSRENDQFERFDTDEQTDLTQENDELLGSFYQFYFMDLINQRDPLFDRRLFGKNSKASKGTSKDETSDSSSEASVILDESGDNRKSKPYRSPYGLKRQYRLSQQSSVDIVENIDLGELQKSIGVSSWTEVLRLRVKESSRKKFPESGYFRSNIVNEQDHLDKIEDSVMSTAIEKDFKVEDTQPESDVPNFDQMPTFWLTTCLSQILPQYERQRKEALKKVIEIESDKVKENAKKSDFLSYWDLDDSEYAKEFSVEIPVTYGKQPFVLMLDIDTSNIKNRYNLKKKRQNQDFSRKSEFGPNSALEANIWFELDCKKDEQQYEARMKSEVARYHDLWLQNLQEKENSVRGSESVEFAWGVLPLRAMDNTESVIPLPFGFKNNSRTGPYTQYLEEPKKETDASIFTSDQDPIVFSEKRPKVQWLKSTFPNMIGPSRRCGQNTVDWDRVPEAFDFWKMDSGTSRFTRGTRQRMTLNDEKENRSNQMAVSWSSSQIYNFIEKILLYGKDFKRLASCDPGKTVANCIDFYQNLKFLFGFDEAFEDLRQSLVKQTTGITKKDTRTEIIKNCLHVIEDEDLLRYTSSNFMNILIQWSILNEEKMLPDCFSLGILKHHELEISRICKKIRNLPPGLSEDQLGDFLDAEVLLMWRNPDSALSRILNRKGSFCVFSENSKSIDNVSDDIDLSIVGLEKTGSIIPDSVEVLDNLRHGYFLPSNIKSLSVPATSISLFDREIYVSPEPPNNGPPFVMVALREEKLSLNQTRAEFVQLTLKAIEYNKKILSQFQEKEEKEGKSDLESVEAHLNGTWNALVYNSKPKEDQYTDFGSPLDTSNISEVINTFQYTLTKFALNSRDNRVPNKISSIQEILDAAISTANALLQQTTNIALLPLGDTKLEKTGFPEEDIKIENKEILEFQFHCNPSFALLSCWILHLISKKLSLEEQSPFVVLLEGEETDYPFLLDHKNSSRQFSDWWTRNEKDGQFAEIQIDSSNCFQEYSLDDDAVLSLPLSRESIALHKKPIVAKLKFKTTPIIYSQGISLPKEIPKKEVRLGRPPGRPRKRGIGRPPLEGRGLDGENSGGDVEKEEPRTYKVRGKRKQMPPIVTRRSARQKTVSEKGALYEESKSRATDIKEGNLGKEPKKKKSKIRQDSKSDLLSPNESNEEYSPSMLIPSPIQMPLRSDGGLDGANTSRLVDSAYHSSEVSDSRISPSSVISRTWGFSRSPKLATHSAHTLSPNSISSSPRIHMSPSHHAFVNDTSSPTQNLVYNMPQAQWSSGLPSTSGYNYMATTSYGASPQYATSAQYGLYSGIPLDSNMTWQTSGMQTSNSATATPNQNYSSVNTNPLSRPYNSTN
eukprot:GHVP01053243.1.p1 GENE.GHVP01053243.1~~GHVP01053243.1.p1  ORF type:complete len:1590 (+),score=342.35 GHVP01053243.1:29-4798(+)